jgi:hypothetical protein
MIRLIQASVSVKRIPTFSINNLRFLEFVSLPVIQIIIASKKYCNHNQKMEILRWGSSQKGRSNS